MNENNSYDRDLGKFRPNIRDYERQVFGQFIEPNTMVVLERIAKSLETLVEYEREKNYRAMMQEIKEYEMYIKTGKSSRPTRKSSLPSRR